MGSKGRGMPRRRGGGVGCFAIIMLMIMASIMAIKMKVYESL